MKVFKPNDLHPGDVLEWVYGRSVILVVEVDAGARRVDTVMLVRGEGWMAREGERVSTLYTCRKWRQFNPDFRYVTRGWEETLFPENVPGAKDGTIEG